MTQEDAEDMHRLALGGSSAVSGDASEPRNVTREEDEVLRAAAKNGATLIAKGRLASQASPAKRGAEPSDEQWYDIAQAHAMDDWNSAGYFEAVKSVGRDAIRAALAQSAPSEKLAGAEATRQCGPGCFWYGTEKDSTCEYCTASHAQTVPQVTAGQVEALEAIRLTARAIFSGCDQNPDDVIEWYHSSVFVALASHAQTVPQVPAGQDSEPDLADIIAGSLGTSRAHAYKLMRERVASLQPEAAGAAQPSEADPLQGAANWLKQAIVGCMPADIARNLLIGHNRAKRLFDAARTPTDAGGEA